MSAIKADTVPELLAELTRSRFWGTVQIDYQNGQPILVRKTETIKMLEKGNTHHGNSDTSR